ncbi:alpha/beta hydrolase [Brachybacterium hainanense]|uniref:Alpha/beta hydrolase n=1 Tax=Brachybacterium hainanense TaxID=1541174 RepID=A0ABV6RCN1_9MICO
MDSHPAGPVGSALPAPAASPPLFPAALWEPLPRPADRGAPLRIPRAAAAPEVLPAGARLREGPQVLGPASAEGMLLVRFRHRAPEARAVALQASGWWRVDPVDACDLQAAGSSWWEGTFVVPAQWRATYAFLEHLGPGDPPWWKEGLRLPAARWGTGPGEAAGAAVRLSHGAVRGGRRPVVSLPDDGPFGPVTGRVSPTLHTLERGAEEPAVHLWISESSGLGSLEAVARAAAGGPGGPGSAARAVAELPLLIVLDGFDHADRLGTPARLERAVRERALPPLVAVFVDSGPRRAEVLGVPGGHARWIAEVLLPRLRERGLGADASRTVITGSSFGGLTSLFALALAPGRIGAAIAQSVSLWRYPEGALLAPLREATAGRGSRLRLQAGTFEGTMAQDAERLVAALRAGGADASLEVVPGGHDWAWWQPLALRELARLLR